MPNKGALQSESPASPMTAGDSVTFEFSLAIPLSALWQISAHKAYKECTDLSMVGLSPCIQIWYEITKLQQSDTEKG